MISVTDLRNGTTFKDEGEIYEVLNYEHIKMGRGTANIKVKVKNLRTGGISERSFISGAKVNPIEITKKQLQFLYKDTTQAYFMDPKTFSQTSIPFKIIPQYKLLKEGEQFTVSFLGEESLGLVLPPKMEFRVVEAGPGIRGNSATNIFKEVILENGLKIKVPLFIKVEDRVLVDTRALTYYEKTSTA